jgi:hypothetical protein
MTTTIELGPSGQVRSRGGRCARRDGSRAGAARVADVADRGRQLGDLGQIAAPSGATEHAPAAHRHPVRRPGSPDDVAALDTNLEQTHPGRLVEASLRPRGRPLRDVERLPRRCPESDRHGLTATREDVLRTGVRMNVSDIRLQYAARLSRMSSAVLCQTKNLIAVAAPTLSQAERRRTGQMCVQIVKAICRWSRRVARPSAGRSSWSSNERSWGTCRRSIGDGDDTPKPTDSSRRPPPSGGDCRVLAPVARATRHEWRQRRERRVLPMEGSPSAQGPAPRLVATSPTPPSAVVARASGVSAALS